MPTFVVSISISVIIARKCKIYILVSLHVLSAAIIHHTQFDSKYCLFLITITKLIVLKLNDYKKG